MLLVRLGLEKDNKDAFWKAPSSICFNRMDGARISRVSLVKECSTCDVIEQRDVYISRKVDLGQVADLSFKNRIRLRLRLGVADSGGEVRRLQTSAARLAISAMANSMRSSSLFQRQNANQDVISTNIASMQRFGSKKIQNLVTNIYTWPRNRAGTINAVLCRCGEATS